MHEKQNTHVFNSSAQKQETCQSPFYKELVKMRAKREDAFINDRGFRHIKSREDQSGFTYAFWLIKE